MPLKKRKKRKEKKHFVSGEMAKIILLKTQWLIKEGMEAQKGVGEVLVPSCAWGRALEVERHRV